MDSNDKLPHGSGSGLCRNKPEGFRKKGRLTIGAKTRIELKLSDFVYGFAYWTFAFHSFALRTFALCGGAIATYAAGHCSPLYYSKVVRSGFTQPFDPDRLPVNTLTLIAFGIDIRNPTPVGGVFSLSRGIVGS